MEESAEAAREPIATHADLIDLIYAATLDPHRYDELVARWQAHLDGAMGKGNARSADDSVPSVGKEEIARHFDRAFAIMERMGREERDARNDAALVGHTARPAMLVGQNGRIRAVNVRARQFFGITEGDPIESLDLEATGPEKIRRALARLGEAPVGRLLTLCRAHSCDGAAPIVVLSRVEAPRGESPAALIAVADIGWSDRVGARC